MCNCERISLKNSASQKNNQGYINGNKFFFEPLLTTRRGIYYFHPDLNERTNDKGVQKILPFLIAELNGLKIKPSVYAKIDPAKCAFCYSCYRVCPHAALEPDLGPDEENNAMKCTEAACMACGACVAICPGQAITLHDESVDTQPISRAEKTAPAKSDTCKVFCCENSAYWAIMSLAEELDKSALKLDVEKIPCGGRVGQDDVVEALVGYDRVLLAVCVDDACKHMVGGKRACQNTEQIAKTVEQMKLPGKKVVCVKASCAMKRVLAEEVKAFMQDAGE
jgi:coenzyme F420-reducing hydrogenase delta subunit/NAD-dependent dihydropyrimidine dehydrogenase PreA subunit